MKKFLQWLLLSLMYFSLCYLLAVNIAYLLSFEWDLVAIRESYHFTLDPQVMLWQNNLDYIKVVGIITLLGYFYVFYSSLMGNSKEREKKKAVRKMSKDERRSYKHLASKSEIKKGRLRLQFDKDGHLDHQTYSKVNVYFGRILVILFSLTVLVMIVMYCYSIYKYISSLFNVKDFRLANTLFKVALIEIIVYIVSAKLLTKRNNKLHFRLDYILDYNDYVFDTFKKIYNKIIKLLGLPNEWKLDTMKTYYVDGKPTYHISGLPVYTKKNKVWVNPDDVHNIVIGTTNSGKTYSIIHGMIEFTRMCGESMIVNDIKGELLKAHKGSLEKDGYNIITINYIDPELSNHWNPFGICVRYYRQAQKEFEDRIKDAGIFEQYEKFQMDLYDLECQKYVVLTGNPQIAMITNSKSERIKKVNEFNKQIKETRTAIDDLLREKNITLPDYSDALEAIKEVADIICPTTSKDPFWDKSAANLLQGTVCFLLEEQWVEDGKLKRLEDDQINFTNIKLCVDSASEATGDTILWDSYLDAFRDSADWSTIHLKDYVTTAEATRGSIKSVFAEKLSIAIINERIAKISSETNFDFEDIVKKKTAVFLLSHDEKSTYYPLITLFFTQLYQQIVYVSRNYPKQRLPINLRVIWDEFGISPVMPNIENLISAGRFRGILCTFVVQDFSQLNKYKDTAKSLKNNVMNMIYLLAGDPDTLKEVSNRAGKRLVWNTEANRYQDEPVISPERLSTLKLGEAVVMTLRDQPYITKYVGYGDYNFYPTVNSYNASEEKKQMLPKVHIVSFRNTIDRINNRGIELIQPKLSEEDNKMMSFNEELRKKHRANARMKYSQTAEEYKDEFEFLNRSTLNDEKNS